MGTKISKYLLVRECLLHQNNHILGCLSKLTEKKKKKNSRLVREASERPKMTLKALQSPETERLKLDQSTIYRVLYNTALYEGHKRSHYSKRSV